ncbi:SCP2 sterol-binding domain-containing protein [Acinetobacter sp. TUM15064]|uniref:SCP2 sterol-binding domain-containing protein n=1 Tax=Acinetobacter sp. TUM15064 TaxID=2609134 RepID=UPI00124DFC52|nr:SCP2 sterol-binding domain-containing protein [Acinetobacter sp. TUM15064]
MNINDFILNQLPTALNPENTDGVECILQLQLSAPYVIQINDGTCDIQQGENADADVVLTTSDEVFIELITGKIAGAMAFMSGKLKIDGDIMLAKEISDYFIAISVLGSTTIAIPAAVYSVIMIFFAFAVGFIFKYKDKRQKLVNSVVARDTL